MGRANGKVKSQNNGTTGAPKVSKLGRDLRRIKEMMIASGEKMLTLKELEREIANRRAGNY